MIRLEADFLKYIFILCVNIKDWNTYGIMKQAESIQQI